MNIMQEADIRRAITRLASQAVEKNEGTEGLVLLGIRMRGVVLARRMRAEIARLEGVELPLGILDISLHRDDLLSGCDAVFKGSEIDFDLTGKNVALCDDVLYTGRTVRSALAAINSLGRANSVRFYTLVDRGGRELPFYADGTGKHVPAARSEKIVVRFTETDGEDSVEIVKTK